MPTLKDYLIGYAETIFNDVSNPNFTSNDRLKAVAAHMPALAASVCLEFRKQHPEKKVTFVVDKSDLAFETWKAGTPEFKKIVRYCNMPYFMQGTSEFSTTPRLFCDMMNGLIDSDEKTPVGINSIRSRSVSQWLSDSFLGWHCAHEDEDGMAHTAVALAPKSQPLTGQLIQQHIEKVGGVPLIANAPEAVALLCGTMLQPPADELRARCIDLRADIELAAAKAASKATTMSGHDAGGVLDVHDRVHGLTEQLEAATAAFEAAGPLVELHAYRLFMTLLFNNGRGTLVRGESPIVLVNPVVVHVHGTYLTSMATECSVRGWVEPSPSFMLVEQIVMQELMLEYRGSLSLYGKAADAKLQKHQRSEPHKHALWWRLRDEGPTPIPPMCARDILLILRDREPLGGGAPAPAPGVAPTAMTMRPAPSLARKAAGAATMKTHDALHAETERDLTAYCKTRVKLAANTAAAFQAAAVIFVAQSDAGSKFRDREGRAAAQSALEAAVKAMLYDV